jgi:hypothetical protein
MLYKRSISPLIATILLIVVSVILITVVLTWGKGFTENTTNQATDLLESSKNVSKRDFFWQTSLVGNQLVLRNISDSDLEIKGYRILTNDYNSDYFWLNSYRPLENNILFNRSSIHPISLVCVPENKFFLELIDINDQPYTLEINPQGNRLFTSCNTFNVPLWEFETIGGAYEINEFNKTQGELIINNSFDNDLSHWYDTGANQIFERNIINPITGTADLHIISNDFSSSGIYSNSFNIVYGKSYKLLFKYRTISGVLRLKLAKGNSTGVASLKGSKEYTSLIEPNNTSVEQIFVALESFSLVRFLPFATTVGTEYYIDSVSLLEVDPLPTITDGTKYLECNSSGDVGISFKQAYGTWEFDVSVASSSFYIYFISSENKDDSYALTMRGSGEYAGRLYFKKMIDGSMQNISITNLNYFKANIWYTVRIERTRDNSFKFYIKGGDFEPTPGHNNWTLVNLNTSNPVSDNTYLESKNLFIKAGSGDKIAQIRYYPE